MPLQLWSGSAYWDLALAVWGNSPRLPEEKKKKKEERERRGGSNSDKILRSSPGRWGKKRDDTPLAKKSWLVRKYCTLKPLFKNLPLIIDKWKWGISMPMTSTARKKQTNSRHQGDRTSLQSARLKSVVCLRQQPDSLEVICLQMLPLACLGHVQNQLSSPGMMEYLALNSVSKPTPEKLSEA